MINLTLLGCGGGTPTPHRFLSSMMISYNGRKILIDCGEGTQVAMKKFHTGFKDLDIICITHIHGDHIFGLPGLLSTMGNSGRRKPVTLLLPLGASKAIEGILSALTYLPFDIKILEFTNRKLSLNTIDKNLSLEEYDEDRSSEIILDIMELDHSTACNGYSFYLKRKPKFDMDKALENQVPKHLWNKLQKENEIFFEGSLYTPDMVLGQKREGIKVSYITDTRPMDSLISFIEGSQIFICEGTYGDNEDTEKAKMNKHMTFKEAAILAREARVNELLLTHFSPSIGSPEDYIENAKEFFTNTVIGYDGFTKILNFMDE